MAPLKLRLVVELLILMLPFPKETEPLKYALVKAVRFPEVFIVNAPLQVMLVRLLVIVRPPEFIVRLPTVKAVPADAPWNEIVDDPALDNVMLFKEIVGTEVTVKLEAVGLNMMSSLVCGG